MKFGTKFGTRFAATLLVVFQRMLTQTHGVCTNLLRANKHVVDGRTSEWTTRNNAMFYGNELFHLKGINWNGFESDCNVIHGLWANSLDHYLDLLHDNNFNAIRLPIPYEIMNDLDIQINPSCIMGDNSIHENTTIREFLPVLLDKLQARAMFAVFDLHTIGGVITEFPWTDTVSEDQVLDGWWKFAQAVQDHPAVMGFEIKNEPHGQCTTEDFHDHCANVILRLGLGSPFKGLYFISGTSKSPVDGDSAPWGGTFEGISGTCEHDALCRLNISEKIVFAPHVYGPDVRQDQALIENNQTFERRFGFLKNHVFLNESAIVVTEFGGLMEAGGPDMDYFQRWSCYMKSINLQPGAFFWTFPPSSDDTGGLLLDDYQTVNQDKMHFLDTMQPRSSKFYVCT